MTKLDTVLVQAQCSGIAAAQQANAKVSAFKSRHRVAYAVIAFASCMLLMLAMGVAVFAAADDVEGKVQNGLNSAFKTFRNIAVPLAIIALVICGIKMLFGGQKGMETARNTFFAIAIALAIILLAPVIIKTLTGWFGNNDGMDYFKYSGT